MPTTITQRRAPSAAEPEPETSPRATAAAEAAAAAPRRRRRAPPGAPAPRPFLTSWELAPAHIKDNQFILRGYRAGHTFWSSLGSVFRLHNETGNIWTHLVGFIIFICLTVATLRLHPAPLRLGGEALGALEDRLVALEHRMTSLGSRTPSLFDLVAGGAAWERAARAAGAEGVALAEQALRSIRRHNLGEVTALADALKGGLARRAASAGAELAALEARLEARLAALGGDLSSFSAEAARDLESALHRGLASIFGGPGASWPAARWPMVVFTAGAMACLLTSCVCHVFGCCAAHVAAVMWRFDYAGIAVLIVASFFPPVYYGFLCRPALRAFYLLITSALGLSTLGITLMDRFQHADWHPYRAALFVGLGLWGIVPMSHGFLINSGSEELRRFMLLDVLMGAIYIGGAVLYATRIPERWKPGAFDVAFHSHQLFHIAVVVAAIVHYNASIGLMRWRDATGGCALEGLSAGGYGGLNSSAPAASAPLMA